MEMSRAAWLRIALAVIVALAALLFVRLHNATGITPSSESSASGHRLAAAWCKDCHSIEATTVDDAKRGPAFTKIANLPSTTELSLKVFLQTNHPSMPNLVIAPREADDLVSYILSLKRN